MQKAIIGKKVGMTQIFDEKGNVIPVTVIEAGPCTVVQKKTVENDGYASVQLGFEDLAEKKVNKPMKGHFEKAGVSAKKYLKEFRLDKAAEMNVGDVVKADVFAAGDKIDVIGTSKGKGYAGVVKRWNATALALFTAPSVLWALTPIPPASCPARRWPAIWALSVSPFRTWKLLRLTPRTT